MLLPPGAELGRYRILSSLGDGGMGEVYLAEDLRLNRQVAIKIMKAKLAADEQARARFEREARMAAALDHPNICTLHEIGHDKGHDFLVMQRLAGETLFKRVQRESLGADEAIDIAVQLAEALDYAHAQGVIHRDIKPHNVMLTPDGRVKLMDFGLAKALERPDGQRITYVEVSQLGDVLGTVEYISPEQLAGSPADRRSDIFSLGMTLYEMFAGKHPLIGPTPAATIAAITTRPAPPLRSIAPDAPAEIEPILAKALAIRPEDRYQSVKDLLADLRAVQAKRGRSAGPDPHPQPIVPARPWRKIAAATVLVLLVAGSSVAWWMYARSGRASPGVATITTWLEVQAVRDGVQQPPREAVGKIDVETGWRFTIHVQPPGPGALYLISEEEVRSTKESLLSILYPTPDEADAARRPNVSRIDSGPYRISGPPSEMTLWIVWSAQPVAEMDALTPFAAGRRGIVTDAARADAARRALDRAAGSVTVEETATRAIVRGSGPLVMYHFTLNQQR